DTVYETVRRSGLWKGELRLRRKDDSEFDAALTCRLVSDSDASAFGVVTVIRDVSQEKIIEAHKARFVSNASHELRTPLTNLQTRLYLLRRQPERAEEHLAALERTAQRMKWLVEELLELARIERGVMTLKRQKVTMQSLVGDVLLLQ